MAVLRLDVDADSIENTLSLALVEGNTNKKSTSVDPLASSTWEEVPAEKTLITPIQCKSLWRQFKTKTEFNVSQAIAAQEANKRNNNWMPPPWAILALVVLGFNEFMTLLRNPMWLLVIFVGFLLVKALWVQLDISGEFRNGAVTRSMDLIVYCLYCNKEVFLRELIRKNHLLGVQQSLLIQGISKCWGCQELSMRAEGCL